MIDWLYHTGMDISILIGAILLIRKPVRHYLGAQVVYWMWLIPLIRLVVWIKAEVPAAIFEKISFPNGEVSIQIFNNPDKWFLANYFTLEKIWIAGIATWFIIRFVGWLNFKKHLIKSSAPVDIYQEVDSINSIKNHYKVKFFQTTMADAPFITGISSAQIYLNKDFFEHYSQTQKLCVLKHELTHHNRKDLWVQLLAEVMRTVFWFNPIVHIAYQAFRQDQELACDHSVLAACDDKERLAYGHVLLKGLHAHALPSALSFFNNHKQRFTMLEKHKNSFIKNILGISLCATLTVFALTKAPESIASEDDAQQDVSFKFNDTPLKTILMLIADASEQNIVGYEKLPDINITVEATHVSSKDLQNLILSCTGFKLLQNGSEYEITSDNNSNLTVDNSNQCINKINKDS